MDTDWAKGELTKFIQSAKFTGDWDHRHVASQSELVAQAQVVEQIFSRVIPDWRDRVKGDEKDVDNWRRTREVAERALAQIQRADEIKAKLGDSAPDLNASHMHPWVWDGARSLWASTHFRQAVSAAAVKVNAET